jgi:long-chain acyl-CoA synthetase
MILALYGFDENTIYLSPAPLYHAAPLRFSLGALYAGGTVIVMEHFDALESLVLIEKHKVTHSQWVPTMFIRMLKLPEEQRLEFDISSLKIAIHAAAPIPIPVKEKMIEWWGPILFEYYAGTEANGLTAITSEEWMRHKGSVGRSFIGTAHILDEEDKELPPGEPGLIYFGDGQDFEYHDDPEKTKDSRSPQGWTTINDIGYLDEEGYLYLTDRASDTIISGGVNIYPREAENVLIMHPAVMDAAVLGVPNEEFGEEVKGVVQPRDMSAAGPELEQELMTYCRSKLSKIKCPVSIDFEAELPRTATGKLVIGEKKEKFKVIHPTLQGAGNSELRFSDAHNRYIIRILSLFQFFSVTPNKQVQRRNVWEPFRNTINTTGWVWPNWSKKRKSLRLKYVKRLLPALKKSIPG